MEARKNITEYRLPGFAKVSRSIFLFGGLAFIAFGLLAFFEKETLPAPVIFLFLSFVLMMLGGGGIEFSTKEYLYTLEDEDVSIVFEINLTIFLFFLPLIVSPFDKNISLGNVMYIASAIFFYVFVACYTALLLWHKNRIRKIINQ